MARLAHPSIDPWLSKLRGIPPELITLLDPALRRLALAIAPFPVLTESESGTPDGYDGLTRLGIPERILASEWALALEAPTLFVQRAADRELLHLKQRWVAPLVSERCVVLCAGGPSQHGQPRLVQLAALLVLWARARAADVAFSFATLEGTTLTDDLTADSLMAWRRGASWQPAKGEDVQRWKEQLELAAGDELWLLGASLPEATYRVEIEEQVWEDSALSVSIVQPSRTTRVQLESLDGAEARRAFQPDAPQPQATAPQTSSHKSFHLPHGFSAGPVWFSPSGHRVLAPYAGGVVAIPVPNSLAAAQNSLGRTHIWPEPNVKFAGYKGRKFVGIEVNGDELILRPSGRRIPTPSALVLPTHGVLPCYMRQGQLHLLDGGLCYWKLPAAAKVIGVLGLSYRRMVRQKGELLESHEYPSGKMVTLQGEVVLPGPFFAVMVSGKVRWPGVEVQLRPGERAVSTARAGSEGVIVLAEADTLIRFRAASHSFELPAFPQVVDQLTVSPTHPTVVIRFHDGPIEAWCLQNKRRMFRLEPPP